MQIQNKFQVPLPLAQAWVFLMNIEEVAPCFPGVTLTEIVDADTQKGKIRVKLGPVVMIFAGTVHFEYRDEANYGAEIKAAWREEKGRGTAATVTQFKLTPCDGGTEVSIDSDVQLAGQVAQYGRGLGMISEISEQLIAQFAANLREKALALHAQGDAAQPGGNADGNPGNNAGAQSGEYPAAGQAAGTASSSSRQSAKSVPQYQEISGFSILWKVLAARIKAIFVR